MLTSVTHPHARPACLGVGLRVQSQKQMTPEGARRTGGTSPTGSWPQLRSWRRRAARGPGTSPGSPVWRMLVSTVGGGGPGTDVLPKRYRSLTPTLCSCPIWWRLAAGRPDRERGPRGKTTFLPARWRRLQMGSGAGPARSAGTSQGRASSLRSRWDFPREDSFLVKGSNGFCGVVLTHACEHFRLKSCC